MAQKKPKKAKSSGADLELKKQIWVAWTRDVIGSRKGGSIDPEVLIEQAVDVADGMLEAYEELETMLKTGEPRRTREEKAEDEEDDENEDDEEDEEGEEDDEDEDDE